MYILPLKHFLAYYRVSEDFESLSMFSIQLELFVGNL